LREALKNDAKHHKIIEEKDSVLNKYTWSKHADLMIEMFRKVGNKNI